MRAKNVRPRANERRPAAPPRSGGRGPTILAAIALLLVGGALGVIGDRAVTHPDGSPTPSSALASSSPVASEPPSPSPTASPSPSPSPSPAAAALESMMPKAVDGATLTVQSTKDVASLGTGPAPRALGAAIKALGKKPADFEFAAAFDESGTLKLTILGFRLPGVDPVKLRPIVLNAYLAADIPGVKTTTVTLSGHEATKISYGDSGNDEYALVYRDALLLIETPDAALAARAASALGGGTVAAPSPSPTASSSASGSPSVSGSPSASESPAPSPS